jgi:hypothetical protein
MPGANIVLSQMNKREKVFGDAWDESTVDKFALFLNRKAGKPYIKVDQSTVTNQISFSHDGNKWDYTLELDPDKALADYKPSINSMFNIFIDNYTYTIKSVKVTGSITARGGQPIKNKYEIVCGVTVTYKGIKINISNAMLTFTENFSKYNKVTQVVDEYVNPIS